MSGTRAPLALILAVNDVHADALFGEDGYLLAVAALEQAKAHFKLADYFLMRKD